MNERQIESEAAEILSHWQQEQRQVEVLMQRIKGGCPLGRARKTSFQR